MSQLEDAFKNIVDTVKLYKTDLMTESTNRKLPPLWNQATIEFAIRWILTHYLSDQRHFRQNCIYLSKIFAQCYDENDPSSFFKALLKVKKSCYFCKKLIWD